MSNRSDSRKAVSRFPLPATMPEALSALETFLDSGAERIEIFADEGIIRVTERVSGDIPLEEETSWTAALRNVETFEEYQSPGAESFQIVVDMMHLVAHYQCHPVQWVIGIGGKALVDLWLELDERGMPGGNDKMMGVPFVELDSLPEESLILCGSKYPSAGPDEISLVVKTTVEMRSDNVSPQHRKVDDRGWNGSGKRAAAAGAVETATSGLRLPKWTG